MAPSDARCAVPVAAGADPADVQELRDAVGPGYGTEWGLFCDYTRATDQPTLPTTVEALTGFLTALPARPATLARRIRGSPPHTATPGTCSLAGGRTRRSPPVAGPARPGSGPDDRRLPHPRLAIRAVGRRDAFLIVLTEVLGYAHRAARELHPDDISMATLLATGETVRTYERGPVPDDEDPRRCAACAVVRWLELLGVAAGLGCGSARMDLAAAHAPTTTGPHRHQPSQPARWSGAPVLLPAIDRHGWHDDYRPMTTRAIRTRLALADGRVAADGLHDGAAGTAPTGQPGWTSSEAGPVRAPLDLDDILTMLDDLADDALNNRIQALLTDHTP